MTRTLFTSLLGAALFLGTACSFQAPRISEAPPTLKDTGEEKAYQATLARYTATDNVYDRFDTRLFAAATFQTEAFRRSRAKRQAYFDRLPDDAYQELLAKELGEAEKAHAFIFGAHLNDMKYDDFDRANSVWRVALVTPVGEFLPSKKERVGRGDEAMRAYFPYMDTFWVGYRLSFPTKTPDGQPTIPEGTETVTLRVSSSLGQADFEVPAK